MMSQGRDRTTLITAFDVPVARPLPDVPASIARDVSEHDITGVYLRCRSELFSFVLRGTRDRALAEDVVQEAFVRLVNEAASRGMPDRPRAWLYRVAANLVTSRGRHLQVVEHRQPRVAVDELYELGPDRIVLARERHGDLAIALDSLAPAARAGLVLAARGYSGREVASTIGRTDAATRTLLCRARSRLRRRLGPDRSESAVGDVATIRRDAHPRPGPRRPRRFAFGAEPAT